MVGDKMEVARVQLIEQRQTAFSAADRAINNNTATQFFKNRHHPVPTLIPDRQDYRRTVQWMTRAKQQPSRTRGEAVGNCVPTAPAAAFSRA
jgi:BRCT domain type II-containing protein